MNKFQNIETLSAVNSQNNISITTSESYKNRHIIPRTNILKFSCNRRFISRQFSCPESLPRYFASGDSRSSTTSMTGPLKSSFFYIPVRRTNSDFLGLMSSP